MQKKFSTLDIVLVGMLAAVLAVVSQISLPMPNGVPITIQVFAVALVGVVLGWKLGLLSCLVYIMIGAVGAPVFANFRGGLEVLVGMSGGYIIAWPVMTALSGIRVKSSNRFAKTAITVVLALIGLMVVESVGGFRWAQLAGDKTFGAIMAYSFVAFIPKDAVLTVLAVIVGEQIKKPLVAAGYLK